MPQQVDRIMNTYPKQVQGNSNPFRDFQSNDNQAQNMMPIQLNQGFQN